MLLQLMVILGIVYYWTWFLWPFVFVASFGVFLSSLVKTENGSGKAFLGASVSLLLILAGIVAPYFQV